MLFSLVGKQFTRIRIAHQYLSMIVNLITPLSLFVLVLLELGFSISIIQYVLLVLFMAFGYWLFGFFIDKTKIIDYDLRHYSLKSVKASERIWKEAVIPQLRELFIELKENE